LKRTLSRTEMQKNSERPSLEAWRKTPKELLIKGMVLTRGHLVISSKGTSKGVAQRETSKEESVWCVHSRYAYG